ncbi:unnamed protein product [Ixodes pacificus]
MNTLGGDRRSGIYTAAQLPRKLIGGSGDEVLGLLEIRANSSSSKLRPCNATVFVVPVVLYGLFQRSHRRKQFIYFVNIVLCLLTSND